MTTFHKEYIGDAVYACISEFREIILTTEDGIRATNTIILDPTVRDALSDYLERHRVISDDDILADPFEAPSKREAAEVAAAPEPSEGGE